MEHFSISIKTIVLTSLLVMSVLLSNITTTNQTYSAALYTMTNYASVALLNPNSTPYMWMYDTSGSNFQIEYDMGTDTTHQVLILLFS
jgi:hypothetical protein